MLTPNIDVVDVQAMVRISGKIVARNMNYATFKLIESNGQLANSLLSKDEQLVGQAMRNFITAKLRKESGASISPTEFEDARALYFPQLGDSPEVLAQKKQTRDGVLSNLIEGSGNAYKKDINYVEHCQGIQQK